MEAKEINFIGKELIGDVYNDKNYEVDLMVELENKDKIVVEMNTSGAQYIINRNLFYITRVMSRDLKVGEKYNKFHNHIQINFDCTGNHKRPISRYRLREDNDVMDELSDKLTIFKIDIPYFVKKCYNEDVKTLSEKDRFLGLLGCDEKKRLAEIIGDDKSMKKIQDMVNKYSDDLLYYAYDKDEHYDMIRQVAKEECEEYLKDIEATKNKSKEECEEYLKDIEATKNKSKEECEEYLKDIEATKNKSKEECDNYIKNIELKMKQKEKEYEMFLKELELKKDALKSKKNS